MTMFIVALTLITAPKHRSLSAYPGSELPSSCSLKTTFIATPGEKLRCTACVHVRCEWWRWRRWCCCVGGC